MPTGRFTIGDLTFELDGSLKELAHCQAIIREINQAEYRLQRASGADEVKVIYDQDLEGERGTFDKMRLRAYDGALNYTLDIGTTDNNPLGIYVGYDKNIEVYNRETGQTWEITPDGDEVEGQNRSARSKGQDEKPHGKPHGDRQPRGGSPPDKRRQTAGPGRQASPEEAALGSSATSSSGSAGQSAAARQAATGTPEPEEAMNMLIKQASVHPDQQLAENTTIGKKEEPLDEKIRGFAKFCGRNREYLRRVQAVQGFEDASKLQVGEVEETLRLIFSEQHLRKREKNASG